MSAYKNLFDTHLHTEWSGDSSTPVSDQINRAKELGLSGITITDHMDLDFPETPDRFKLDLPNYLSTLKKLALQESSPDFEILIGMELGLQPQCVDDNHSLLRNYNFDYIIGSLHLIDGMDPYYDSFYEALNTLSQFAPAEVIVVIQTVLKEVTLLKGYSLVAIIGFLTTLYLASNSISVIIKCLNQSDKIKETRGFLYTKLLSICMVFVYVIFLFFSVNLIIFGQTILNLISKYVHIIPLEVSQLILLL